MKKELKWIQTICKQSLSKLYQWEKNWKKHHPKYIGNTHVVFTPKNMIGSSKQNDMYERILEIFETLEEFHLALPKNKQNKATPYRIRVYHQVVQVLRMYPNKIYTEQDIERYYGTLGKGSKDKMKEIVRTGTLKMYEEIQTISWFEFRREMLNIVGFGPSTIDRIMKHGIMDIQTLEKEWKEGRFQFTELQEKGLKYRSKLMRNIPRKQIETIQNNIIKCIAKKEKGIDCILAGSYRTGKQVSGDIDLLFTSKQWKTKEDIDTTNIMKCINLVDSFIQGDLHMSGVYKYKQMYIQLDIRFVPYLYVETYLLYFGSGVDFSRYIRMKAKKMGYRLTEWGLTNMRTGKKVDIYTETGIMKFLNIPYIPPHLRRGVWLS
jgi:DNA polymerase/3'-5' exonuclease PolX